MTLTTWAWMTFRAPDQAAAPPCAPCRSVYFKAARSYQRHARAWLLQRPPQRQSHGQQASGWRRKSGGHRQPLLGVSVEAAAGQPGGEQQPTFMDLMNSIVAAMQQQAQQQQAAVRPGAYLSVEHLTFQPPGAPAPLLRDVSLTVPPNTLGLLYGRSGAGKTTLLQAIAGLAEQNAGSVSFSGLLASSSAAGSGGGGGRALSSEQRMAAAGLVFQFPERHFIGRTLGEELTVGWPSGLTQAALAERQKLSVRAYQVLAVVGLAGLDVNVPLASLSDGYKRRVALAVQLVRRPALLLLDEPLAGLDWRTRNELITLLAGLKSECTMLVVSHDLRELAPLADSAWRMRPGGVLEPQALKDLPISSPD